MENQIQRYGVYIKGDKHYVRVTPYPYDYIDYKYFDKIPFVQRSDDALEAIIFKKNFNPDNLSFGIRSFNIKASNSEFPVELAPMGREDMYKVTAKQSLPKDTILFIDGISNGHTHIISLGEPQEQLEKLFSNLDHKPAYAMLASLEDSCSIYPQNKTLQDLIPIWKDLVQQESDKADYQYVSEAWKRYENTQKIELQIRYLYETYREINGYVEKHPIGKHAKEMLERQEWIDVKLEELEKLV